MIYVLGGLSFLVQILCILHILRTGRNQIWIWIVLLGSMLGCTAYFAFELMPEFFGPGSRFARQRFDKMNADPVRHLNQAEKALAQVDTAANRIAMGDAHAALGAHVQAAVEYQIALDRMNGSDAMIEGKLAQALFESGRYEDALKHVERLAETSTGSAGDRLALLKARIFAETGRSDDAAPLFEDVITRLPGEEARCRYAALLIDQRETAKALDVLKAVDSNVRQRGSTMDDPAMLAWAAEQLKALRA